RDNAAQVSVVVFNRNVRKAVAVEVPSADQPGIHADAEDVRRVESPVPPGQGYDSERPVIPHASGIHREVVEVAVAVEVGGNPRTIRLSVERDIVRQQVVLIEGVIATPEKTGQA